MKAASSPRLGEMVDLAGVGFLSRGGGGADAAQIRRLNALTAAAAATGAAIRGRVRVRMKILCRKILRKFTKIFIKAPRRSKKERANRFNNFLNKLN